MASSIHWRTEIGARLISSNKRQCPSPELKASIKGPSVYLIPSNESILPEYFPNKSDIFVSLLKLNLKNLNSVYFPFFL